MKQMTKRVAFLIAEEFEDSEMRNPYDAIVKNGSDAVIIGLEKGTELKGKKGTVSYTTHLSIEEADASEFDAVIIPGGRSPARLRENDTLIAFVKEADRRGIPISAICHGPQVLARAGLLKNKTFTAYPGIAEEIAADGAIYVDKPVVIEGNYIMSRTSADEPAFIEAMINRLGVEAY